MKLNKELVGNEMFGKNDCKEWPDNITGMAMVVKPSFLKKEFQQPKYQIFIAEGGFGCIAGKIGTAVYGTFADDGEQTRLERYDFIGPLKDELAEKLIIKEDKDKEVE